MATLTKYFNEIVPPSIDVCVRLGKTDFLFEKVKFLCLRQDIMTSEINIFVKKLTPMIETMQIKKILELTPMA